MRPCGPSRTPTADLCKHPPTPTRPEYRPVRRILTEVDDDSLALVALHQQGPTLARRNPSGIGIEDQRRDVDGFEP